MELAMIQDKLIEPARLDAAYMDRGTFFGDGVYEVVRTYDGRIFALDQHLSRFARSLKSIEIEDVDINDIRQRILSAWSRVDKPDCAIYFHITRGCGPRDHCWPTDIKWNFFLTISEITDYDRLKETGVKLCFYKDLRWHRCDIKSLNLLPNVLAKQYARRKGCYEAILVDGRGDITEGSGSAFAAIYGKDIVTRPLGHDILPSITRGFIGEIAALTGMNMVEKILCPWDIYQADEMFIGVTTKDIIGVTHIEGRSVSGGKVGPATKTLQAAFRELVNNSN
jgi:D-alanine transaminase